MVIDLDPFLRDAVTRETIPDFAAPGDTFSTAGGLQFDTSDNPRRLRSGHVLDFKGATLELDVERVTDEMLRSGQAPLMIGSVLGSIAASAGKPEEAWAAVSSHISVRNVRFVGNYSKLAPRARALGVKAFSVVGAGIQGHSAEAIGIILSDFGAYGREGFPLWAAGVDAGYDAAALEGVDPAAAFESASLEYTFRDYVPLESDSQVTVGMITGALAGARHILRRDAALKYYVETPPAPNLVQGGTIYQSQHGTVDGRTRNASVMYYSDYYQSRGIHLLPSCSALDCEYAAIIRLSPVSPELPELAASFSAEDFIIEHFESRTRNTDIFLNADLLAGAEKNPATRYLRNIAIDERLSVSGNKEGLVTIPGPATKRSGCARLNPFHRS